MSWKAGSSVDFVTYDSMLFSVEGVYDVFVRGVWNIPNSREAV